MPVRPTVLLGLSILSATAFGEAAEPLKPVVEIKQVRPQPVAFQGAKRGEPLVLKSAGDIDKHFGDKDAAKLKEQVDLQRQVVLLFAWRGSGQDRLSYEVLESFPEQVRFTLKAGLTRDLRPHVRVFALRQNVRWTAEKARRR